MGYFDGLTAASFKRDSRDRELFFIWGKMGKGRVVPSAADGDYVRGYLKYYYIAVFVLLVPIVIFMRSEILTAQWFLMLGGLMLLALLGLAPLFLKVRDWEVADEKMTFREAYAASGKAHGRGTMLALVIVSALFVLMGLLLMLATDAFVVGLLCTIFFGACLGIFLYMLRASRQG